MPLYLQIFIQPILLQIELYTNNIKKKRARCRKAELIQYFITGNQSIELFGQEQQFEFYDARLSTYSNPFAYYKQHPLFPFKEAIGSDAEGHIGNKIGAAQTKEKSR